jgi:hypothetical protein
MPPKGTRRPRRPPAAEEEFAGDLRALEDELRALRAALGQSYQVVEEEALGDLLPPAAGGADASAAGRLAAVRAALDANRGLQARLRHVLEAVARAQGAAAGVQAQLRAALARRAAATAAAAPPALAPGARAAAATAPPAAGVSWFWAQPGAPPPPPYPGAAELAPVFAALPLTFPRTAWSEDERRALREGVLQAAQEAALYALLGALEAGAAGGAAPSLADFEARRAPIAALDERAPEVLAAAAGFGEEEWARVARRALPARSGVECRLQWLNAARPDLATCPFSAAEDAALRAAVAARGERDWAAVAAAVSAAGAPAGRGARSRLAALVRWQQLAPARGGGRARRFTAADMERLLALVARHGQAWRRVADEFGGGWDALQLLHHWRRHDQRTASGAVAPRLGLWTPAEDAALRAAVALRGRKWSLVARDVPGRTDVQCRERYVNVLAPEVRNVGSFTAAEDAALARLVPVTARPSGRVRWAAVARELPGRTDRQCCKRWGVLSAAQSRGAGAPRAARRRRGEGSDSESSDGGSEAGAEPEPRRAEPRRRRAEPKRRRGAARAASDDEDSDAPAAPPAAPAPSAVSRNGRVMKRPARLRD